MPLRFDLGPNEKLYLGRSIMINGRARIDFVVDGSGAVLREKDYLEPALAISELEKLYCCIQQIYLENDAIGPNAKYLALVGCALEAGQIHVSEIAELKSHLTGGQFYKALKQLQKLLRTAASSHAADLSLQFSST